MITVLLNWGYIFIITYLIGLGFFKLLSVLLKRTFTFTFFSSILCGIAVTTVYAQLLSLFCKIGFFANLLLVIFCIVTLIIYPHSFYKETLQKIKLAFFSWQGLLYIGLILFIAFYTSRGTIHTDTSLYHAQAIRWYEEYGVVKGLGNLQWHFAYNSSYFAFASLFSLKFLCGQSLHCTTGFIAIILILWSLHHLRGFLTHTSHMCDMCCVGILFYMLVNLTGCVSPASDYASMYMALYLIARWCQTIEQSPNNIDTFALLSIFSVYVMTLKLSTGLLILLVIFPLVYLIKAKRIKDIFIYFGLGFLTAAPFLIRNVIISGWLLYPFAAIDLFQFDWKMPERYVNIDSSTIKVWARCLYDPKLIDMPFQEWLPIWWNAQERYSQMLILTNLLALVLNIAILLHKIITKSKRCWNTILLNLCTFVCLISWLFLAPFIRYGLAFLLAVPMLSIGMWLGMWPQKTQPSSFYKLFSGSIVFLMFFVLTPYWDHYFVDDIVFIKQNLKQPYYICQKDYDTSTMKEYDMNGIIIYCPEEGQITGYDYFPSSSYDYMIQLTELRGTTLKDGFRSLERE
ncbi:MAG TPA: hypothetical protein DEB74_17215 [Lachnospiraceae bacterium]|nr:hypothetical protein [Lachnospiraceae bacterium]